MIVQFTTKEQLLARANNLKFFNKKLEEVDTVESYLKETGGGLIKWMKAEEDYNAESALIKNIKLVKNVIDKTGDDALEEYERLTKEPDKSHPLFDMIIHLMPEIEDVFIPMKQEVFVIYSEIYKQVFMQ